MIRLSIVEDPSASWHALAADVAQSINSDITCIAKRNRIFSFSSEARERPMLYDWDDCKELGDKMRKLELQLHNWT